MKEKKDTRMKYRQQRLSPLAATAVNLLLVYAVYMLCRIAYVWENWGLFGGEWRQLSLFALLRGSLRFDSSAIFYTNVLYIIMMLLPLRVTEQRWWRVTRKSLFLVSNSIAVAANLSDAVYSQFTGRRTTASFFTEFAGDDNLGKIFFTEMARHWYLVLVTLLLMAALWVLYAEPAKSRRKSLPRWALLLVALGMTLVAMRGGIINTYRPIGVADAGRYVNRPTETAIVLNTPFSVIRTMGKTTYVNPHYFDDDELSSILEVEFNKSSAGQSVDTSSCHKNVVVIILESFGREYTGYYNKALENGKYKGYTPFLDSLLSVSLTWEQPYANGRRSIDAIPAIVSGIPMFVEPFFTTGYSLNKVSSFAAKLKEEGYSTAFFHGANNGSMGFDNYALAAGFDRYYGRNEYNSDKRFGGDDDFDGIWAIWDEPFLQYYATMMSEMQQPFATALFTASSHHPFAIPEEYKDVYVEEEMLIHKCIRYTDNALRQFFATASRQPWFDSTIFVITNDHTNMTNHDEYKTPQGLFAGTLLIYDPSGELPRGKMAGVAQHTDIMPTILGLLGYSKPFVAFGNDLLNTPPEERWTVNYSNGIYQFLQNDTLIQFDGNSVVATYKLSTDPLMQHKIASRPRLHERKLKALIQQYTSRMIEDRLD